MLLVGLWANREYPGLGLAFVGVLSNTAVIVINGGYMPIYEPSLIAAGFTADDVSSAIHVILPEGLNAAFLLRLGPLGDVIPIPLPIIQNVISIGDVFLSVGLAFFLFASVVRTPEELDEETEAAIQRRVARIAAGSPAVAGGETGYPAALTDAAALERPIMLGGSRPGISSPSLESTVEFGEGGVVPLRPDTGVAGRDPRASVRPSGPQRLVLGALGRPADLALRRSDPPARHRRDGLHGDGLAAGRRPSCSSRPRCRTCSSRRSRARSWIAGTSARSSS